MSIKILLFSFLFSQWKKNIINKLLISFILFYGFLSRFSCIVVQKQSGTHGDSNEGSDDDDDDDEGDEYRNPRPQPKGPNKDNFDIEVSPESDPSTWSIRSQYNLNIYSKYEIMSSKMMNEVTSVKTYIETVLSKIIFIFSIFFFRPYLHHRWNTWKVHLIEKNTRHLQKTEKILEYGRFSWIVFMLKVLMTL